MQTILAGSAAAIALAFTLGLAPAQAQPLAVDHIDVSYAGLDLTTDSGAAYFDRRLVQAAAEVCDPGSLMVRAVMDERKCNRETLTAARSAAGKLRRIMVAQRSERGRQVGG
jgi:UrcA family protein